MNTQREPRYTQAPAGYIPGGSVPPRRPPANPIPQAEPEGRKPQAYSHWTDGGLIEERPQPGYSLRAVLLSVAGGFVLGAGVLLAWAMAGHEPAQLPEPAGLQAREAQRGPDAENIGAGIQRVDDWERGIACYRAAGGSLSCVAMPAEAPAQARTLEKVVL